MSPKHTKRMRLGSGTFNMPSLLEVLKGLECEDNEFETMPLNGEKRKQALEEQIFGSHLKQIVVTIYCNKEGGGVSTNKHYEFCVNGRDFNFAIEPSIFRGVLSCSSFHLRIRLDDASKKKDAQQKQSKPLDKFFPNLHSVGNLHINVEDFSLFKQVFGGLASLKVTGQAEITYEGKIMPGPEVRSFTQLIFAKTLKGCKKVRVNETVFAVLRGDHANMVTLIGAKETAIQAPRRSCNVFDEMWNKNRLRLERAFANANCSIF